MSRCSAALRLDPQSLVSLVSSCAGRVRHPQSKPFDLRITVHSNTHKTLFSAAPARGHYSQWIAAADFSARPSTFGKCETSARNLYYLHGRRLGRLEEHWATHQSL